MRRWDAVTYERSRARLHLAVITVAAFAAAGLPRLVAMSCVALIHGFVWVNWWMDINALPNN